MKRSDIINENRIAMATAIALIFIAVGYFAPLFYFSYIPVNSFATVDNATAQDANTSDSYNQLSYDSSVSRDMGADVHIEMVEQNTDEKLKITVFDGYWHLREGGSEIVKYVPMPRPIDPGEYRYVADMRFHVGQGVTRDVTIVSNTFEVTGNATNDGEGPKPIVQSSQLR